MIQKIDLIKKKTELTKKFSDYKAEGARLEKALVRVKTLMQQIQGGFAVLTELEEQFEGIEKVDIKKTNAHPGKK
jgi:hypothetical protein